MFSPTRIHWLVLLFLLLAACAPVTRSDQPARPDFQKLNRKQSVGQSFLSRYDGLSAVEVYLEPNDQARGNLFFYLKEGPKSQTNLRTVVLSQEDIQNSGFQRFEFDPIPGSNLRSFYSYLHTDSDSGFRVGTSGGKSYLNGSQYLNDLAVDAQSTFRLVYNPYLLQIGLFSESLQWAWYLLAAFILFILPGWALLSWFSPGWELIDWPAKFTWSIGASLPIYPLLFLWADVFGIHAGRAYAWITPIAATIALVFRNRERLRYLIAGLKTKIAGGWVSSFSSYFSPLNLALLLITGLIILVRFWTVRTLPTAMWGDSYQHTMISQLLVDNNGLFQNWQPYADLYSFTYHFGFHSLVAVFHWITGLSLPQATLWTGQIINVLAVLALYPLAVRLGRSPWAGVIAVLLAGLLSPMPMFYTNWGRYTQLAGQAILPAAVLVAWDIFESRGSGWRQYLPAWIIFAGLALTHYRILVFAACFIIAYVIINLRRKSVRELASAAVLMGLGAGLLFLPWLVRVFAGNIPQIFRAQITTPASQVSAFIEQYNSIGDLFSYLPAFLWLLLPIAIAWGFWRRERDFALISLWWLLILFTANPQLFHLPGSGVISNFAVFIAAYIPVSMILGTTGYWVAESVRLWLTDRPKSPSRSRSLDKRLIRWAPIFFILIAVGTGLWGARQRLRDIQPAQFSLVTWPDMHAAAWIQENIPPEARFLVNSFFAYGDTSIVGSDAGWWLPLIAGRATTLPPLTYASERGPRPDYHEWINALSAEIETKGIDHPDVLESLQSRGVTHVFIGQQQGSVNDPSPQLDPKEMLTSPNFTPIYHQDRIWIFKINQTGE